MRTVHRGGVMMPKHIAGKLVYSIDETAAALGIHRRSVYRYIKEGRLIAQKFGRSWHITQDRLQEFLDGEAEKGERNE